MTFHSRPTVGQQPFSATLKFVLAEYLVDMDYVPLRDDVIVHHYTDRKDGLQLEVEIRSTDSSIPLMQRCRFMRINV